MHNNTKFLQLYKEYETLLRENNLDAKEVEDASDDLTGNRLRYLRQTRNYLSHNKDNAFITVSDAQITFLSSRITSLQKQKDMVKKHTKKALVVSPKDKVCEVLSFMASHKLTQIGVHEEKTNTFFVVSIFDMIAGMPSKTAKMESVKHTKQVFFLPVNERMEDLVPEKNQFYFVTEDGTKNSKVFGGFLSL